MSEVLKALIIGIVQGLTEFLPVSSSGHIEIAKALTNFQNSEDNLLFSIVVHGATCLSTIFIFWKDILEIFGGLFKFKWNASVEYSLKIIISMVPVMVVGLMFKDELAALFDGEILFVGCMLILTGLLLLFTHYAKSEDDREVGYVQSFIIGIAQAIAILPGISRSGSTIATALLLKTDKGKAAKFSFLMVLIPILGATALEVKDFMEMPAGTELGISGTALVVGFFAAFLTGLIACKWMISLVKNGKLTYFAFYCFAVGGIAVATALLK